jgi:hypothetical protein
MNANDRFPQFVFTSSPPDHDMGKRSTKDAVALCLEHELSLLSGDRDELSALEQPADTGTIPTSEHTSPDGNNTISVLRTHTYNNGFGDSGFNCQRNMNFWLRGLEKETFTHVINHHRRYEVSRQEVCISV